MTFLVILLVLLVAVGAAIAARRALTARHQHQLEESENIRLSRKVANEDVTQFGEELSDLHIETLTTTIDEPMRLDYQRALDSYETAKQRVHDANDEAGVTETTRALEDGRFAMACVLARRDGRGLPARRPPCFFNPAHGPAAVDVEWAPLGGVAREIPVCFGCEARLAEGERPDVRLVRWSNRHVPWFQGGRGYHAYAEGYYGRWVEQGLFPSFILVTATDVPATSTHDRWAGWDGGSSGWDDGPGTFDGGGHHGGFDGGGYGGDGGGFDVGGFDGGGGGGGGDG
jgi:hypothetical protein